MTLPDHAVRLERLTKRFAAYPPASAGITAVDGVELRIARGELFGLLGPNGAGKTTTIRLLCTLLLPTEGTAWVWGYDIIRNPEEVRRHIGVLLAGERSVYWKLTGRENLQYFAELYQVPRDVAGPRIAALLDAVELTGRADDLVERYSTGMRQRLALIKAILHDPPVLMLDEPTTGLDPQGARNIRELIRRLHREGGKTIILTTHHMEEADQLCERVGIIDHGRVIALDSPQALKRAHQRGMILRMEVEGAADRIAPALRPLSGVTQVTVDQHPMDGAWDVTVELAEVNAAMPKAVQAISDAGLRVRHVQLFEASLEDVFIALTGRRLRD